MSKRNVGPLLLEKKLALLFLLLFFSVFSFFNASSLLLFSFSFFCSQSAIIFKSISLAGSLFCSAGLLLLLLLAPINRIQKSQMLWQLGSLYFTLTTCFYFYQTLYRLLNYIFSLLYQKSVLVRQLSWGRAYFEMKKKIEND